jgi:hypothetical protein
VIHNDKTFFTSKRLMNEDGSLGGFDRNLQEFYLPKSITSISVYPYDDEHLLLYSENAV